ncbi:hypothetical protein BH11CYA1_BH11CYA1_08000 [soil metagenome]
MQKRKLFISFTGLMYALKNGRVNDDDLANGLFVFGCSRGHAITPGAANEHIEDVVVKHPEVHERLVKAVLHADFLGRVRWRTSADGNASFQLVNEVLVGNQEDPLISHKEAYGRDDSMPHYNYPSVQDRCPHLEVVF